MFMLLFGLIEYLIILSIAYFPPRLIPNELLLGYIDVIYQMEEVFAAAFNKREK